MVCQNTHRSCGYPISGGWMHPGQADLVGIVPAHGRGVGTRWSLRSLPTQTIL